ncbi:hypothetical protein I9W82_002397 [Candida metapsilosis]|uniref:Uncharacterized protein n=1 Tax=Candida metapsilosis TaxID=273372 RepID=A0A8H8DE05_9ASCO|nr:hypothetical protein I9W82_002397 [Candida metapsilosis]
MSDQLRQDQQLRPDPQCRSYSEPLTNKPTTDRTCRRPYTADNEITHVSDSEDDMELLPVSTTSQSTFQTKLNSVLPTFTMEEDYLVYDGSGTVESQLSNENFHCVDFASGGDEKCCAVGSKESSRSNPCSSLSDSDGLEGTVNQRGSSRCSDRVSCNGDDDDVILIGSSQVVADNSSSVDSELERNIDIEDETTEELDKSELLKDLPEIRSLSPIHEQKFDVTEIQRCSTPISKEKKVVKSEHKGGVLMPKVESASNLGGGFVKEELDPKVVIKRERDYMDEEVKEKSFVKKECLKQEAIAVPGVLVKKEKIVKKPAFEVKVEAPAGYSDKKLADTGKDKPAVKSGKEVSDSKDEELNKRASVLPSLSSGTVNSHSQENKQRILKRKRIASKPLSAIVNTPRTRVGLSKRVKVEHLHKKLGS